MLRESLLALLVGGVCGGVFALARLPVPAPPVLSGVIGVLGVYSGYTLIQFLLSR